MFRLVRHYLLFLLNFVIFSAITAQEHPVYVFNEHSLESVLEQIENDHQIEILFLQEWVQNQQVSGSFSVQNVEQLLNKILVPHGLSIVKYDDYTYVLIYKIKSGQIIEHTASGGEIIKSVVLGEAKANTRQASIEGRIIDAEELRPLVGAAIYIKELEKGTVTDTAGFFQILLPVGKHQIEISNLGYHTDVLHVILQSDDAIEIPLLSSTNSLKEVIIRGRREVANTSEGQMSRDIIEMEDVEYLPSLMGEKDVIKTIEMLPGVNATGEGANGYSVRGGNAGQNLIFLEGAPLYNPSHLFGLFSVFNPGVIKSAVIYKGAMPTHYGGRVSSVMDVNLKSGEGEKWHGEAGLGLISSRMHLEGPINKKLSMVAGGKISYVNRYLDRLENFDVRESRASFYDMNTKLSYFISERNTVTVNAFMSGDDFTLPVGDHITYGNKLASAKWTHIFSEDVITDFTTSYSGYFSTIHSGDSLSERQVENGIATFTARGQVAFYKLNNHALNAGFETGLTMTDPGSIQTANSLDTSQTQIAKERGLESAVFVNDEFSLNDKVSISLGLRYSKYLLLGPGTEYFYAEGRARRVSTVIDSLVHPGGHVIKGYGGLEPRFFFNYAINNSTTFKFNFGRSRQYLHLIFNAASVSPLNIWKLSDTHLKAQVADLAAVGVFKNFRKRSIEISGEIFFRRISNLPDYRNGAKLLTNPHLERDLVSGSGKSYGIEFQFTRKVGKLNGWLAYAYVRSFNRMNSVIPEEQINQGETYPSDNDRPHSVSLVGDYLISRMWSLSFNWIFNTGRPISFPEAIYYHDGMEVAYYSKRNEYRIPDYHRLDLSLNLKGTSLKINKKWDINWAFSVYNVYGRANAYSIYFERDRKRLMGKKLSILSSPVPSVTLIARF